MVIYSPIFLKYLRNGDAITLHPRQKYYETKNYITANGLAGFSVTKNGDVISVFSL